MKHNLKITLIILAMFLITQFIGLYIVSYYSPVKVVDGVAIDVESPDLPLGLETPDIKETHEFNQMFLSIIIAFVIAISLLFLLTKFKSELILKLWFFVVIIIALVISFQVITSNLHIEKTFFKIPLIALLIALPLAFIKVYRGDFFVHNFTELLIYPGIAAVFVPILNIWTIIALLVIISAYDIWAVWHSGIMQKMAKFQIHKLKVFAGFFVPYISKKVRMKLKRMKKSELKHKKIKANVAILGGGDVVFPLIAAGVMLKTLGFYSALLVIAGAVLGLSYLLFFAEKKKFYPAMPYISAGIFIGIALSYLIF